MDDEQNNEQEEDADNSITLEDFMEQFTDDGGTIVDLIDYMITEDKCELDVAVFSILWDWITIDGLELLEYEDKSNRKTHKLFKRIAKNLKTILK